jgi:hypothetical protein
MIRPIASPPPHDPNYGLGQEAADREFDFLNSSRVLDGILMDLENAATLAWRSATTLQQREELWAKARGVTDIRQAIESRINERTYRIARQERAQRDVI